MTVLDKRTDIELTKLLKSGDHIAFTELYHRYWKLLLGIAYHYTKDKPVAEEVVQEVFVGIWNRRELIEIQSFKAYMATAVKFSVFKYIHREAHRKLLAETQYQQETVSMDDKLIESRFLQEYINGIVEQLPDKCKLVFKYSRQQGKSTSEIASQMGIAEKTVEAHLTKGLKTLKAALKSSGILFFVL
ncbi:RNA polymerase sigma-70 factor [Mucilaginibacter arboris]|uniref:RNA polymerase sigma-70 factor n=1 Tax=Mucilaginibacter arboris TaxID=2682090 RepID=A0A7K1ST33_9SPHI|nr:RNA polymerase sigma-70 factor [Mucilaginibacter arboris]MVN20473.1 RNA polymerase sigma-70 factor [Mucilaginibacter arboris]